MAVSNQQILDAILGLTEAIKAQHVVAEAPVARTTKANTRKSPAKGAVTLTKRTRKAFIAAAAKEGVDLAGLSTWDIAYYCVAEGFAPKGFVIGEGYTVLAVEAGA